MIYGGMDTVFPHPTTYSQPHYALLLEAYRSGQITHAQWQEHLRDEVFVAWLKKYGETVR